MTVSREVRFGPDDNSNLIGWIVGEGEDLRLGGKNWSKNVWQFFIDEEREVFALGCWMNRSSNGDEETIWYVNAAHDSQIEFLRRYKNFIPYCQFQKTKATVALCKNSYRGLLDFLDDRKDEWNLSVTGYTDPDGSRGITVNDINIVWRDDSYLEERERAMGVEDQIHRAIRGGVNVGKLLSILKEEPCHPSAKP